MKGIACPSAGIVTRPATLPGCSGAQPTIHRKIGQIRSGSCIARSVGSCAASFSTKSRRTAPWTVAPAKGHLLQGSTTQERFTRIAGGRGGHLALRRAQRAPALQTQGPDSVRVHRMLACAACRQQNKEHRRTAGTHRRWPLQMPQRRPCPQQPSCPGSALLARPTVTLGKELFELWKTSYLFCTGLA